jgi:hypothetical protein
MAGGAVPTCAAGPFLPPWAATVISSPPQWPSGIPNAVCRMDDFREPQRALLSREWFWEIAFEMRPRKLGAFAGRPDGHSEEFWAQAVEAQLQGRKCR